MTFRRITLADCQADLDAMPVGAEIYIDPHVLGLAFSYTPDGNERPESGPIGPDNYDALTGEDREDAISALYTLLDEIEAAGYAVAKEV